jgi:hypothetical protein
MVPAIQVWSPNSFEEWLATNFWWSPDQHSINPGFLRDGATQLFKAGLRQNKDVWDPLNFYIITGAQAAHRFGLWS